jgi:hypothetical protein
VTWTLPPEVTAAALGAILIWLFQLDDRLRDRAKVRESTVVAIASEVDAICRLVRSKGYLDGFGSEADRIREGTWKGVSFVADIRGDYFRAYEAFLPSLSHLPPRQVSSIVTFYAYCESAIDSTRPDGPMANCDDLDDKANSVVDIAEVLRTILRLGDEIVQFPKQRLGQGFLE